MLGFAPIGSGPIAGNNSAITTGITVAAAWTEGSETFAATGTTSSPSGVSVVLGWTEGSEVIRLTGYVTDGTAPYVSPSRTVAFEGCVTTVRF